MKTTPPEQTKPPAPLLFFRDIMGQARVRRYFETALRQERLAHAYLFLGPEGVGRASTARALAAALNCLAPREDGDACGSCESCRQLAFGNHPDFLVIGPTSEGRQPQIKIDQIRELRRLTAYPPLAGAWRLALIKPAEALNDASVNALLKTLEEPPAQHVLVLTAQVEADLFPTLVSRCHKLAFTPLNPDLILEALLARGLSREQAGLITAISNGSLGRALTLNPAELLAQRRRVLDDLDTISRGNLSTVLSWAAPLAKNQAELEMFLLLAQLWFRDLLLLHFEAPPTLLGHQDLLPELQRHRQEGSPSLWLAQFASLAAAHRRLQANLNRELTLDILGFSLQQPEYLL